MATQYCKRPYNLEATASRLRIFVAISRICLVVAFGVTQNWLMISLFIYGCVILISPLLHLLNVLNMIILNVSLVFGIKPCCLNVFS